MILYLFLMCTQTHGFLSHLHAVFSQQLFRIVWYVHNDPMSKMCFNFPSIWDMIQLINDLICWCQHRYMSFLLIHFICIDINLSNQFHPLPSSFSPSHVTVVVLCNSRVFFFSYLSNPLPLNNYRHFSAWICLCACVFVFAYKVYDWLCVLCEVLFKRKERKNRINKRKIKCI